jgi:hypothetical protein
MKNGPDSKDQDRLLDAILADESWTEASNRMRAAGVRKMRQGKWRDRGRLLLRCAAVVTVLAGLITSMVMSGHRMTESLAPTNVSAEPELEMIGDAELLALLPEGSAVVAQVNGETMLVFLDPDVEAAFAR